MACAFFTVSGPGVSLVPQSGKAIVTLLIGGSYIKQWSEVIGNSWWHYADKHGFDLIAIVGPLDDSDTARNRSVAWQKCLILSQPWSHLYQRIAWVDADILINPYSPDIFRGVPDEKIGAVTTYQDSTISQLHISHSRYHGFSGTGMVDPDQHLLEEVKRAFYDFYVRVHGLEQIDDQIAPGEENMISTGVLVLSPVVHKAILEKAYYSFTERTRMYEQTPLSYLVHKNCLLYEINSRFNWCIGSHLLRHWPELWLFLNNKHYDKIDIDLLEHIMHNEYINSFFMHFATLIHLFNSIKTVSFPPQIGALSRAIKIDQVKFLGAI
ncbi:MAG: hypothetical protein HQL60_00340 [Magnetococcales bacterium]|nr:hypothetical protein [Magnetococcales bacterium]